MSTSSKNIIIGAPPNFGIAFKLREELNSLGFNTQEFIQKTTKFKYKNFGQRAYNFYRKSLFGDYSYKSGLRTAMLQHSLDSLSPASYALIIRPDTFPIETLIQLREKVDNLIAYQWDGLDRFPKVKSYINLFDKFYAFDPADTKYPNVLPTTNFHMNRDLAHLPTPTKRPKVYYVGSYERTRWDTLQTIIASIDNARSDKSILLYTRNDREYNLVDGQNDVVAMRTTISYSENLENLQSASILLDLQHTAHEGVSFRVFEAIGYDKKVITTNKSVINYDFYNPQNILIWDNQSPRELEMFLHSPYIELSSFIKHKYSLNNWIKYMLDIESYIPIDLPVAEREMELV